MDKLEVDLEHCYGIKALKTSFDFGKSKAYAIYAPNGAMKTSFARTFQDVAKGAVSGDRIFPARVGKRSIVDQTGTALGAENVLVVQPYDEVFGHTEKTSTLLVNSALRLEYEQLHVETEDAKEALLKALKKQSGSKKDLENEVSRAFTTSEDQFFKALLRIEGELTEQKDAPFANLKYDILFDEKAVEFLATPDVRSVIKEYIEKYNELLASSVYFKKGVFNYYNAGTIAKILADNGLFKAKHSIRLHSDAPKDISTREELEDLIAKEKEAISEDAELRQKFTEIENLLQKNAGMRTFDAYLKRLSMF